MLFSFAMLFVLITICPTVGWIYRHLHITHCFSPPSVSFFPSVSLHRSHLQHRVTEADVRAKRLRLLPGLQRGAHHGRAHPKLSQQGRLLPVQLRPLTSSSFTARQTEKQPHRQTDTDRWTGRMERQVEVTVSQRDTRTGVGFVYCLVKENSHRMKRGTTEGGPQWSLGEQSKGVW